MVAEPSIPFQASPIATDHGATLAERPTRHGHSKAPVVAGAVNRSGFVRRERLIGVLPDASNILEFWPPTAQVCFGLLLCRKH